MTSHGLNVMACLLRGKERTTAQFGKPCQLGAIVKYGCSRNGTDSFGFTYGKFVCNDSLIGKPQPLIWHQLLQQSQLMSQR